MTIDFSSLNENQLDAIRWQDGALLVLAGPGSGKTRVLIYRIARLIEESASEYFKILALTFTNKAAAEMRARIANLVPNAGDRTLLTTFHSFAADILRQHGHHIGLKPDFTILVQDSDRHALLENAIEKATNGRVSPSFSAERLLPLINRLIENDISASDAIDTLQHGKVENSDLIAAIYSQYRSLMIETNTLDFAGLMAEALHLLEKIEGVRKQIQRVYSYICVDEFQDTNLSQYKILKTLINPETKNLFVVADDDQIIYQWNGASPERLQALRQDFSMTLLQLPENYRCPPAVVELANKLIANNFGRSAEKSLLKAKKIDIGGSPIRLHRFEDFSQEVEWVANDISGRGIAGHKCAILARAKKPLERFVEALAAKGMPAYLAARKDEFESAPLQWVHSILRLANARSSREHLRRTCKAFFSLEGIDLNVRDIISAASTTEGDYLRAWTQLALARKEMTQPARDLITTSLPKLADRLDFWVFLDDAFRWLDGLPSVSPDQEGIFNEYAEEKATWVQLVDEICAQYGKEEMTLHQLLQELDLRSKTPQPPPNGIPCFTIHASKGLEFDHVYLVCLVEDQLPSWAAIKKGSDSREMQEERRNCFVAITRAQETLTLTYSSRMNGWSKQPSRFLSEMSVTVTSLPR